MLNKLLGISQNASEHGFMLDHMLEVVHWFMAILFVGWSAFFLYTLYRFRAKRNPKADYRGVTSHFSTHAEITVVLIEAVLLLGFAFPMWAKRVREYPSEETNPLKIRVIGEQFAWSMHYPGADGLFGRCDSSLVTSANPIGLDRNDEAAKDDLVTKNEMHVPVDRPVIINLSSKDVIHNFAIYTMRSAQDAIPGSEIPLWFKPIRTGESEVICGQLCGSGHSSMKAALIVDAPADYEQWLKDTAQLQLGGS